MLCSFVISKVYGASVSVFYFGYNARTENRLRLVTTFYEGGLPERGSCQHGSEVLAALAYNSLNCQIDFVHVLYETSTRKGCLRLKDEIRLRSAMQHGKCSAYVECTPLHSQPSYYDIFNFATSFRGDVVVLANADMVFDESIRHLRFLQRGFLNTIATKGLGDVDSGTDDVRILIAYNRLSQCEIFSYLEAVAQKHLKNINEAFEEQTGLQLRAVVPNRCYRRPRTRLSWDAYAFHPEDITVNSSAFSERSGRKWFMNELGAENAALGAIISSSSAIRSITQVCDIVSMFAFHTQAKTHDTQNWVKGPFTSIASDCGSIKECFGG